MNNIRILIKTFFCLPSIIFQIKNWWSLLLNYAGLRNEANTYFFRNGLKIKTGEGIDAKTIMGVFFRKDYGDPPAKDSVVIDIGANIGVYSLYANAKVWAFEPAPEAFNLLQENVKLNNKAFDIYAFNDAVCSQSEKRNLLLANESPSHSFYRDDKYVDGKNYVEVNCTTLNNILKDMENCDLLKLDCEGSEFEILYNSDLSKVKEIRLEYHNKENNRIDNLIEFLKKDFKLTKFRPDSDYSGMAWFIKKYD